MTFIDYIILESKERKKMKTFDAFSFCCACLNDDIMPSDFLLSFAY